MLQVPLVSPWDESETFELELRGDFLFVHPVTSAP
jgi:hypothetical protein